MHKKPWLCVAVSLSLVATACDSDDPGNKPSADRGELWMVQTRVFSDEGTMGYAIPTGELSGEITNEDSIEQGGGGMVYAQPGDPDGSFMLSYAERPTLTRYEVAGNGKFVKGETLSFANYGVDSGYGRIAWVDEHTAYWVDGSQLQLIRFDPADMKVTAAVPIEGVELDTFITEFSMTLVREDGVYFATAYRKDWEVAPESPGGTLLVHVDPATDEVTVTKDERCTSMYLVHSTPNGDSYWFSNNYNTYARIVGGEDKGVPDCALRLKKGEQKFDPEWELNIPERTGGLPGDGTISGPGSTVWLRVFDVSTVDAPPADWDTTDVSPGWQWYSLDLESDDDAEINEQRPRSGHGGFGISAGGRSFSTVENEDYSETKLLELTEDGFKELAAIEGLLDTLVRVR